MDPALVHHYFGTKDQLLLATLHELTPFDGSIQQLLAGGVDGLGERVIRATFGVFETVYRPMWSALIGLLRSAIAHEDAAQTFERRWSDPSSSA